MNEKVSNVLNQVLERFKTGQVPEAIAISMFPIPNVPSCNWSLLNRTIMFFAGTQDARGIRQWNKVGRRIKKGSKAFYILAPCLKKEADEETEEELPDSKAKKQVLKGFIAVAVFRVEDTEGVPLDYEQIEVPELPLIEVAEKWGISVKAVPGNYSYYGYYRKNKKEIGLASKEEVVFFHELAHAGHKIVSGKLKSGQDWKQEIVAELSAATLCHLVGTRPGKHLGNSYQYIDYCAKKAGLTAYQGCLKIMGEVEKVLNLILEVEE